MGAELSTKAWLRVTAPKAAALLTDWRARRFLEPFLQAPRTMSEVAELLGVKLNTVHYRVGQLVRLGLLEVAGSRKERGRPAKLYGTTADAFFVPFEATPHVSLEDMLHRLGALDAFLHDAARALSEQAPEWGVLVTYDPAEGVHVQLAPLDQEGRPRPIHLSRWLARGFPALLVSESVVCMDHDTAKQPQQEIVALLERYTRQGNASGQGYRVVLGITPADCAPSKDD